MVDKLSPEIGQFHGPRPMIFGMPFPATLILANADDFTSTQLVPK